MALQNVSLTSSGPSPATLTVVPSDKVTFTNNMTTSTVLTLPQCFAGVKPDDTVTIAAGATSPQYNVNGNPNNSYTYSYTAASLTNTVQTGTIDVS